ncbi:rhomboid family intramembrane serine protease [Tersicoccus sp. Bi-70]|nr:rhomboid family intramembrane serine protease [Tersicoccus sp. Bi-70]OMH34179.1 rhomboid family intramembrane serine protease [Tersicoccus sp. Bi-70]
MSFGQPAVGGTDTEPRCPRHPDAVSYVRCQRCGRPACAQCQRPAAVGVQCVDCVAEQAAATPTPRTSFGGAVREGRPVVTWSLIGVCVVVFLLQYLLPGLTYQFGYAPVLTASEPWRMITSGFLHSPGLLLHILFNMYALWALGQTLEPALGRARFLAVYGLALIGGGVGVLWLSDPLVLVVGASGAIFGLFGALFVIQRRIGADTKGLLIVLAINAALGFFYTSISWQAHLGGLLTGALAAVPLVWAPRGPRRARVHWLGLAGVLVLLVALTLLRLALAPGLA